MLSAGDALQPHALCPLPRKFTALCVSELQGCMQVAQVTPAPLKRILSSRPSSRKHTTDDEHDLQQRNGLSSTSAGGARTPPNQPPEHAEPMRRAQTAPFPLSELGQGDLQLQQEGLTVSVPPPSLGAQSSAEATGQDKHSPIGYATMRAGLQCSVHATCWTYCGKDSAVGLIARVYLSNCFSTDICFCWRVLQACSSLGTVS